MEYDFVKMNDNSTHKVGIVIISAQRIFFATGSNKFVKKGIIMISTKNNTISCQELMSINRLSITMNNSIAIPTHGIIAAKTAFRNI